MGRRQRVRHKQLRQRRAEDRRWWHPPVTVADRLRAGRREIVMRGIIIPPRQDIVVTDAEREQMDLAASRGFRVAKTTILAIDDQTREALIGDLLAGASEVQRMRRAQGFTE